MKIPVSGNSPELPPSQADEINDRLDLLSSEVQQIEATLDLYKLEFQTMELEAGIIVTTDLTASNALITDIDTGTINTTDLFKKRSRFVEGTGEKLVCNIKKNNKAIVYCVNSTQSFSIDFINDSGFILSSIPDTIKNIKLYENEEFICLYVDKTTDDLLYFFTDAEQTAINYDEQERSILLDIELLDGVNFFGKNAIEIVRTQEFYSDFVETPLLIKNKEDGTNSFTHNTPATGERAFLITQVMNGRTEFYITHEGNKLATIFVDILDNGEPERLVIVSVAQTDLNIIKVFLLDGIIAIETTYDVLVDVSYFVSADTNTLTPFSFVGPVGVVPNIYNVDITSNRRVIIMGDGTTETGLTIKGELTASVIELPEGLSFENVTIGDLIISDSATLMGVSVATVNDVSRLGQMLTSELNTHIINNQAHGATVNPVANRIPLFDNNAKLPSVLDRDIPIEDTGNIITFDSSGNIVLTNTSTTRTLSAGGWIGQTVTLFNSTASTITVTDGEFTFTVLSNDKREVQWNGTKWESKANLVTANIDNATIKTLTVQTKATVPTPTDSGDATNKGYVDGRTGVYITETGGDNTAWYRKWSDGFIEQGGVFTYTYRSGQRIVNFLQPFSSTDFVVEVSDCGLMSNSDFSYDNGIYMASVLSKTLNNCTVMVRLNSSSYTSAEVFWKAYSKFGVNNGI